MKFLPLFLVLLPFVLAGNQLQANEPDLEGAVLEWQGKSLKAVAITTPWVQQFEAGTQVIELNADTVSAKDRVTLELNWKTQCQDAKRLRWLGSQENVAYIQEYDFDPDTSKVSNAPILRRISLIDGKWLDNLTIPECTDNDIILGVLANRVLVFVLSATTEKAKSWPHDNYMRAYRVTSYATSTGRNLWSKSFKAVPELGSSGPYLWAAKRPNEAIPSVRPLSLLNDSIIVCAGARQSILCLEQNTGKSVWACDRIWEYERGFIGPSVWSHFISRHGLPSLSDKANAQDPKLTEEFDSRWECTVIGGPVVVPLPPSANSRHPASIFVAVAKASSDGDRRIYANYLKQCTLYELSEDGAVVGIGSLPRLVLGSQFQITPGGLIWNCQNNALVCLEASGRSSGFPCDGPGGTDMLIKTPWYRELDPQEPQEWLVTDKAGEPAAFTSKMEFRVLTGGFVRETMKREFNLPIAAIDLNTGERGNLTLRIPMAEDVTRPTSNYTEYRDGCFHTFGPYLLGITGLRVDDNRLCITLGMDKWSAILTFDLT